MEMGHNQLRKAIAPIRNRGAHKNVNETFAWKSSNATLATGTRSQSKNDIKIPTGRGGTVDCHDSLNRGNMGGERQTKKTEKKKKGCRPRSPWS